MTRCCSPWPSTGTGVAPQCAPAPAVTTHISWGRRTRHISRDVPCSGATTADLAVAQGAAPAQYAALSRRTDLVTVSIGGKDIGFSAVLRRCAALSAGAPSASPCRDHLTQGGIDQVEQSIAATAPKISQVIAELRSRAPRAKVFMVGYPSLFPDSGVGCTSPSVPIAAGDFAYLRDKTKALTAMIARRAKLAAPSTSAHTRPPSATTCVVPSGNA
ncbi:GDSL-type esterase/lipase family protein [Streptomyces chartreusis]